MPRSTRIAARALAEIANEQGGYFTAKQAKRAGYEYAHLNYHLGVGNFERVEHGLYRLPTVQPTDTDELVRLTLWSRDRGDEPQAVVSHTTALVLHGLTDLLPNRIHLTVPPTFRKPAPRGCRLHKSGLRDAEIETRVGFRVTNPLKSLIDSAADGLSREQFALAANDALTRGLVRRIVLEQAFDRSPELADYRPFLKNRKHDRP